MSLYRAWLHLYPASLRIWIGRSLPWSANPLSTAIGRHFRLALADRQVVGVVGDIRLLRATFGLKN